MFKIKFCGIRDTETAQSLVDAFSGYNLIFGLRIGKRRHHGEITTDEAQEIMTVIKDSAIPVTATYLKDTDKIIELCSSLDTNWVQITSFFTLDETTRLKENNLKVILSLDTSKLQNHNKGCEYKKMLSEYDLIILSTNSFYPDWGKVAAVSSIIPASKMIIGGWLHPENMLYAIKHVLPTGINIDFNILNYTFGNLKNLTRYINDFVKTFEMFTSLTINKNGGRS